MKNSTTRRQFIHKTGMYSIAVALCSCSNSLRMPNSEHNEEVLPAEDLMREHGVLKRVLLVYRNYCRRIDQDQSIPPQPLLSSVMLIRSFVEDYHEKLEETYLFPRFRKAGKLVELVDTLESQHQAGRRVTDETLQVIRSGALNSKPEHTKLRPLLEAFIRMYEPHEAREDTVLFPAFEKIMPEKEYRDLGEEFENQEKALFGEDGFDRIVSEIASIEKALDIYDLRQFTPY